ncbi:MAG: hypothetical protein BGP24_15360 [Lysobacterales bacterium 69-70]|nr:hypothetical protein [Xanthomonadaceae bacterium]ODU35537.1 MAG: hypothetical protein ABS97_03935 [Xanthomonadaceae bacterium SCN 69-320]ODV23007.1 MAG: hypothetical protein ABT27_00680 [Xanthomonadaceae bacterium SCN 69-25]OJY96681.1 MAG: hypothetical protein BGP24_15360 [Xanthomonadales bacterium 69-70]
MKRPAVHPAHSRLRIAAGTVGGTSLADGRRAFRQLPHAQQIALAEEIVAARRAELALGRSGVCSIGVGLRRRRDVYGRIRVTRSVCIVFVVRRKWPKRARCTHPLRVPEHLWTAVGPMHARTWCAVPTDVMPQAPFRRWRPQAQANVSAQRNAVEAIGTLACLVKGVGSGRTYALGCKHVLSGTEFLSGSSAWNVIATGGGAVLGRGSVHAAAMTAGGLSLDAQLAVLTDPTAAKATLAPLRFDAARPVALEPADIRLLATFYVHRPGRGDRAPAKATCVSFHYDDFELDYAEAALSATRIPIRHETLVEYVTAAGTFPGMSGAPVTSRRDGGMFLGMHIAGDGTTGCFVPAWLLLDGSAYGLPGRTFAPADATPAAPLPD